MAKNAIIPSLSKDEQEALALCGITQDAQLARIAPQALFQELEDASPFFPDSLEGYQPEFSRIEYICQQAAAKLPNEQPALFHQDRDGFPTRGNAVPQVEEPVKRRYSTATGRMLVDDQIHAKKAELLDEARRKRDPRDFSHAICSAHPLSIYLNAWFTIFLVGAAVTLVLIVAGLLIGIEFPGKSGVVLAGVLAVIIVGYAILLNMATCSTCRVSVFSFRRYPRHRQSHHIPLLGYTVATALYTIFFFRYRCPSCGTPQKLFGKHRRGSRSRRSKR